MADQLKEAVKVVRDILASRGVQVEKVLLFGSRARGEASPESDYDLYVLIDRELEVPQRHAMITEIKRKLARLHIPNDVVLRSSSRFEAIKDLPGHLAYDVAREGVAVS